MRLSTSRRRARVLRSLASRTCIEEWDDLDDDPRPSSLEIMSAIDALPSAWRELVHEYGFVKVAALIDDGMEDAGMAWATLSYQRQLENARKAA